jgi:hypothetical protein
MTIEDYYRGVAMLDLKPSPVPNVYLNQLKTESYYVEDPTPMTPDQRVETLEKLRVQVRGY